MSKDYAVLPCNGLDKCAGCISKEVAVRLADKSGSEIICPVFYRVADAKYSKVLEEKPLLVIDGCGTRCASKLAAEKGLKIAEKLMVSDEAKQAGITLGNDLHIDEAGYQLVEMIVEKLLSEPEVVKAESGEGIEESSFYPEQLSYQTYQKDKFVFQVPDTAGFYFNENDVWVYVSGKKARVGVTDYVQKSLSDIMFFTAPTIGMEVDQFDELGDIESGKAVFGIVSPVSGVVTAVNEALTDAPELINQNPYETGWIAELELSDFEEDQELLHDFTGYFPILKRKVDEFHV